MWNDACCSTKSDQDQESWAVGQSKILRFYYWQVYWGQKKEKGKGWDWGIWSKLNESKILNHQWRGYRLRICTKEVLRN